MNVWKEKIYIDYLKQDTKTMNYKKSLKIFFVVRMDHGV